jgi:hypothetical protein
MFSSAGGFRFIQAGGLNSGIYLFTGLDGEISQGYQTTLGRTFFSGSSNLANGNIVTVQLAGNTSTTYARSLSGSGTNDQVSTMILDTNLNQVIVGTTDANSVGNLDLYMSKYNSNGSLQWQRTVGTSTRDFLFDAVFTDNEANIIAVGNTALATNAWVGKFNSSNGNLLEQYTMTQYTSMNSITTDSSGNVRLLATQNSVVDGVLVLNMQSNFTKTWGQYIEYTGIDITGSGVVVDSGGNTYATVRRVSAKEDFLIKMNTSGVVQWQTGFNFGTERGFYATCADNSGNIYIAGDFGATLTAQVIKFDSSGNILWGRGLTGYGGTEECGVNNISWYNGNLLINGWAFFAGTKYGMLLEVPDDGSKVGTYANGFVWGFGPFTKVSSSLTTTSSTGPAFDVTTLANSAGTLTDSSTTVTIAQNIPF